MTPVAAKRLKAIEEYSHLGAGFKIAMRDLEIRGAGNILGPEQSRPHRDGRLRDVLPAPRRGRRASSRTSPSPTAPEAHVDIGITAFIPKT